MKPFNLRHIALVFVAVGVGVAVYKISIPLRESGLRASCQTSLKQLGLATMQYTRDYDERFMRAPNWKDALKPYGFRGSSQFLFCPKTARDYVYNINLSGTDLQAVFKPATLAQFYEPLNGSSADNGKSWAANGVHSEGSNVCFTDGHVKWLQVKPSFWQASQSNQPKIAAERAARRRNFKAREKRRIEWIQKHQKKR